MITFQYFYSFDIFLPQRSHLSSFCHFAMTSKRTSHRLFSLNIYEKNNQL